MEQMEVIWDSIYVGEYKGDVYLYTWYQKDDFYIEIKKHIEYDVLHGIGTFRNPDQLQPYLDKMDKMII